jgi:hypothetical protein
MEMDNHITIGQAFSIKVEKKPLWYRVLQKIKIKCMCRSSCSINDELKKKNSII